jgi:hypothetical protein
MLADNRNKVLYEFKENCGKTVRTRHAC